MKYFLLCLLIGCSNMEVKNTTFEDQDEDGIIMDIHNTDWKGWKRILDL